jgi:hypothetical protein
MTSKYDQRLGKEMPVNNSSIFMKRGSSRASPERQCELIRSAGHKNFI